MHQGMDSFLVVVVEVPEHVGIWHICLRVALVCSVHTRELDWVSNEEHREVIAHEVPVTLLCVELESET